MIKFFRRIRQKLVTENRFSKYLIYAIGEIVLMVIGILIALQINNWNESRIQKNQLEANYNNILEEISIASKLSVFRLGSIETTISANKAVLTAMKSKHKDSLTVFKNNLVGLVSITPLKIETPVIMEFIGSNSFKQIENKELKETLNDFKAFSNFSVFIQEYTTNQYQLLIEPYVVKKLNYSQLRNDADIINVEGEINYHSLFNDLELANILNLKLESDLTSKNSIESYYKTLKKLKGLIQK